MPVSTSIKIEGLDKLLKKFNGFEKILENNMNKAISKSLYDLEAKTKPVTPIKKGRLRSSFSQSMSFMRGELRNYAPHAVYVHEGTSKWPVSIPPKNPNTVRQFLVRGKEDARDTINRNFKSAIDATLRNMKI